MANPWRLVQVSPDNRIGSWFPELSGRGQPDSARNQEHAANKLKKLSRKVCITPFNGIGCVPSAIRRGPIASRCCELEVLQGPFAGHAFAAYQLEESVTNHAFDG